MWCSIRSRRFRILFATLMLLAIAGQAFAAPKQTATFFWVQYDGVTEEYRAGL